MPDLVNTAAHRAARNAASIALADSGAGVASIKLYSAPSGGTLLAVRNLAKPCATVNGAGRIALAQAVADDLVLADGGAAWAEWCDAGSNAAPLTTILVVAAPPRPTNCCVKDGRRRA